jgi:hypothetical protein
MWEIKYVGDSAYSRVYRKSSFYKTLNDSLVKFSRKCEFFLHEEVYRVDTGTIFETLFTLHGI